MWKQTKITDSCISSVNGAVSKCRCARRLLVSHAWLDFERLAVGRLSAVLSVRLRVTAAGRLHAADAFTFASTSILGRNRKGVASSLAQNAWSSATWRSALVRASFVKEPLISFTAEAIFACVSTYFLPHTRMLRCIAFSSTWYASFGVIPSKFHPSPPKKLARCNQGRARSCPPSPWVIRLQ